MQTFDKDLSIVVPVYNEEESLVALHTEITQALVDTDIDYEVIYVDDGSKDRSAEIITDLHHQDERVVLVSFRRNFGQTAGFAAGFNTSSGRVVITLDADGQNDPADIPNMMAKLDESGADVVNGWRVNRQDGFLLRLLPSKIANGLIARSSGVKLHDRGCSMRAFRSEVVQDLRLYGEMHRFIPELVNNAGYTMVEVPIQPRKCIGRSAYERRNKTVTKSSITRKVREMPYFETPATRGRWLTGTSTIVYPALLTNSGINRCISPYKRRS